MSGGLTRRRPGPTERLRALRDAGAGPAPLPALLAACEDPSPDVARAALRQIGRRRLTAAAGPLRKRLLEVDPALTADFAKALAALGDEGAAAVAAAALLDGGPHRRIAAATALEVLAGAPQAQALLAATDDPLAAVRYRALRALTRIGLAGGTRRLELLLADGNALVRAAAIDAAAKLGGASRASVEALAEDRAPQVRQALARHPHLLGPDAMARLLADRHPSVRRTAVTAAPPSQAGALRAVLADDPAAEVRVAAAQRLAEIGSPSANDALLAALADRAVMVRSAVERGLREALGRDRAECLLLASLPDLGPPGRCGVVHALGHLRATGAEAALASLAGDPDRAVRLALAHVGADLFGAGWEPLARLARDADPGVAHAAAVAIEAHSARAPGTAGVDSGPTER
ncbi:MAG: HEAT repeat domain-containing protein [Solirubrobacterales bacterium]